MRALSAGTRRAALDLVDRRSELARNESYPTPTGGLTITAEARALEDAVAGAVVQVVNLSNGRVLRAQAIGPGQARPIGPAGAEPQARRPERAAQLTTSPSGRP
jgi:hypothetical protein